jgi:hypothetical protein
MHHMQLIQKTITCIHAISKTNTFTHLFYLGYINNSNPQALFSHACVTSRRIILFYYMYKSINAWYTQYNQLINLSGLYSQNVYIIKLIRDTIDTSPLLKFGQNTSSYVCVIESTNSTNHVPVMLISIRVMCLWSTSSEAMSIRVHSWSPFSNYCRHKKVTDGQDWRTWRLTARESPNP